MSDMPDKPKKVLILGSGALRFAADGKSTWRLEATRVSVPEKLGAQWPAPDKSALHVEKAADGSAWFYLTDLFPNNLPAGGRRKPESILLVWDASESGARRDREPGRDGAARR